MVQDLLTAQVENLARTTLEGLKSMFQKLNLNERVAAVLHLEACKLGWQPMACEAAFYLPREVSLWGVL